MTPSQIEQAHILLRSLDQLDDLLGTADTDPDKLGELVLIEGYSESGYSSRAGAIVPEHLVREAASSAFDKIKEQLIEMGVDMEDYA